MHGRTGDARPKVRPREKSAEARCGEAHEFAPAVSIVHHSSSQLTFADQDPVFVSAGSKSAGK
jgi:hypothetical protein